MGNDRLDRQPHQLYGEDRAKGVRQAERDGGEHGASPVRSVSGSRPWSGRIVNSSGSTRCFARRRGFFDQANLIDLYKTEVIHRRLLASIGHMPRAELERAYDCQLSEWAHAD